MCNGPRESVGMEIACSADGVEVVIYLIQMNFGLNRMNVRLY